MQLQAAKELDPRVSQPARAAAMEIISPAKDATSMHLVSQALSSTKDPAQVISYGMMSTRSATGHLRLVEFVPKARRLQPRVARQGLRV